MTFSRLYILFLFAGLLPLLSKAQQTNSRNYIISRSFKQSGADPNDLSKVSTSVQYLDGLGRPVQNVSIGASPAGRDIVQPIEYDAAGRLLKKYLPYVATGNGAFQSNAVPNAAAWYSSNAPGLNPSDLGRPYGETIYEQSPLSRPVGERAPGNKSTNSVINRKVNAANQVNRYDYDPAANTIVQVGQYGPGTLTYLNIKDEQGNVTNEFTDMQRQMICRQVITASGTLTTNYVFDDLGLLRAVLQPAYQDVASLSDHAFIYDYDEKARLIVKKVPGGGITEIVYDRYDRPVMSRDANQLARAVWSFTKYDALDRPVTTGEIASAATRATWAANVAGIAAHHEERSNGTVAGYTLDKTAPTNASEANLLTITFYDDYGFSKAANLAYNSTYYPSNNTNVKGQITGSRTRVLPGSGAAGGWLTSATYYDIEYRPVQTIRELHDLGAGSIERISSQYKYDLAPVVSEQKTEQLLAANIVNTHLATYSYDHADGLLSVKEKVTTGGKTQEAFTVAQRYNALGQLKSKWFHSADGTKFRLRTDYTSNIRGWLTDGKTVYKKSIGDPDQPYFGFGLAYANGANYTNGNISQMQWSNKDEAAFTKGLVFNYDGANRLTGSTGLSGYTDLESGITYDKNGNIKTLARSGAVVDNLVYAYLGNRLSSVTDNSASNLGVKKGISNYSYDANGNMVSDGNRNATLTYNYLNLPKTVVTGGKTLTYDYDAAGTKHKYAADTITLKYAGALEYRQVGAANNLYRVGLSEGQAVFRKNGLEFEYGLKDHLGNVRLVFDKYGQVLQKTDYYPFGLEIGRDGAMPKVRNWANRYNFLGKETQVGNGYIDLTRRFYDPSIGRFMQIDPIIEGQEDQSTYQYGWNNPVLKSDPNGDCPSCLVGALIGMSVDYGFQIAGNLADGRNLRESLTNVDRNSILISGVAGFVTSGFSAVGGKAAQFALSSAIDATESVAKQINNNGVKSVTLSQTVSDVVSNKIAGTLTKNLDNIIDVKVAAREADRTARVSTGDPSSTGRARKAVDAQSKLTRVENTNKAAEQASSGIVGNLFQNTSTTAIEAKRGNFSQPAVANQVVSSDATRVQKPIDLIRKN